MQITKDRADFRQKLIDSRVDNEDYWEKKRDRLEERPTAGRQIAAMKDPPQWFWDLLDASQMRKYSQGIDRAKGVSSLSTLKKMKDNYLKENNLKSMDISKMVNNVKGETRADRNMLIEDNSNAQNLSGLGLVPSKIQAKSSKTDSPGSSKKNLGSSIKKKNDEKLPDKNIYNSANMAILDKEQRAPKTYSSNDPKSLAREIMGITPDQSFGDTMNKRGLTSKRNVDVLDPIAHKGILKHPS
jgi:hypothetical protein